MSSVYVFLGPQTVYEYVLEMQTVYEYELESKLSMSMCRGHKQSMCRERKLYMSMR